VSYEGCEASDCQIHGFFSDGGDMGNGRGTEKMFLGEFQSSFILYLEKY
jgi:hypothetical protein